MTTRQNEIRRILSKMNGSAPDDALVAKIANIAEAAEIMPGDALFPLMVALDYYRVIYETVPESIKEASGFLLRQHAAAFKAEADKITADKKAQLEEATAQTFKGFSAAFKDALPGILSTEIEKAATLAVREPVGLAATRFEKAAKVAEIATDKLRDMKGLDARLWLVLAIGAGIVGGVVVLCLQKYIAAPVQIELTADQQNSLKLGAAVNANFSKLPPQVQKMLKDAAEKIDNKKSGE